MSKNNSKICVIIPAFNEEDAIGRVVAEVLKAFRTRGYRPHVIVVDDCSADKTSAVAKIGGATVIRHIINVGAGGATATGLSYAQQHNYDIACTMDADGQHAPEDVLRGVDIMLKCRSDLLIGSRLIDANGMSKVKVIGNQGLSILTNILFGVKVTDSQSGLRIFSKNSLKTLKWKTSGYEFCSEMLWRARQNNLIISEFPIKAIYTDYSMAKGQNNWNAFLIIKSLLERRVMEMFNE